MNTDYKGAQQFRIAVDRARTKFFIIGSAIIFRKPYVFIPLHKAVTSSQHEYGAGLGNITLAEIIPFRRVSVISKTNGRGTGRKSQQPTIRRHAAVTIGEMQIKLAHHQIVQNSKEADVTEYRKF